jgi:hypothetical protein
MDNFIGYFRKVTTNRLKVNNQLEIGNKAIFAGTGTTYYVDSDASNAADTNSGRSWARPLATISGAIAKCTANQGDTIILAESHSETYTDTGAKFVASVAGITIIGLGEGSDRATLTFSHVGATTTISAANVTIYNVLFVTGVDQVVTYGTISGADCKLINCETRDATGKDVIDAFTVTTTADRLNVFRHKHKGDPAADQSQSIFNLTGADDFVFEECSFMTKCGTGVIELASQCLNGIIDKCNFYVDSTSNYSKNVVDTAGTSTVIINDCFDLEAMGKFSGGNNGSGFSVAGDDVGAVNTKIGTITNTGGTATIGGALGDVANIDVASRLIDACKTTTIADGTGIPDNSQAAGGLLATATNDDVLIEDIIIQRAATNFAGPTNYEFSTDNVAGLTGAGAPVGVLPLADFEANDTTVLSLDGSTKQLPFVLESGKKLYIHGDDAATSAGGSTNFYIKYKRLAANAYLA